MLDTIFGLPTHPLVVHATVVVLPTASVLVALASTWPRFRVWAGPAPALTAVLACVLVPLTTGSGEELEHRVGDSALVDRHADQAGTLIWLVIPLAVAAVVGHALHRRPASGPTVGRGVLAGLAIVTIALSGATLVDVALIGHSGAKASWSNLGDRGAPSSDGATEGE